VVEGVETDRGRIESPFVVDAAGAWARQVAAHADIHVPMVPTRHQVLIIEPIEGVRPELPIVRVMDAAVYVRPCWGGFLAGGYETTPTQFDMDRLPKDFSIADTPLDLEVLRRLMDGVREQLPVLSTAPLGLHRGGIPTMTPDGQHIVGPVPGAAGFFVASGCNVAGLSIAPAIGEELARWIVDGRPSETSAPCRSRASGRSGATSSASAGPRPGNTGTSTRTTRRAPEAPRRPVSPCHLTVSCAAVGEQFLAAMWSELNPSELTRGKSDTGRWPLPGPVAQAVRRPFGAVARHPRPLTT